MKTFSQKTADVTRNWVLIDASSNSLGRVSSLAAKHLIGKGKPTYTPHIDGGDHVVVINAKDLKVQDKKLIQKKYYRHSGHPGGIKELDLKQQMEKDPRTVIEKAVKGMLPKNKLQSVRLARLHVYNDENHNHAGQKPQKVEEK